jgi:hypothetical protein
VEEERMEGCKKGGVGVMGKVKENLRFLGMGLLLMLVIMVSWGGVICLSFM